MAADEQGAVQGSLNSLASVAGIIGMPMMASMFGYFASDRAPAYVPGIAFFMSATLDMLALVLTIRAFRNPSL